MDTMIPHLRANDPLRRELINVMSIIRDTEHCISIMRDQTQDSRQTNADLFNLHANDYVEAVSERRKLWLDNSRLRLNVQRELLNLLIDTFSDTAKRSGDLLGAQATFRLGQELEARKAEQAFQIAQVTVSSISKNVPASKTQNTSTKTKQGKKKNNYNSTPANTNTDQPSLGGSTQSRGGRGGGTSRGRGSKPYTPNKGKKSKKGSSD